MSKNSDVTRWTWPSNGTGMSNTQLRSLGSAIDDQITEEKQRQEERV
jgi:hypothetical protein